MDAIPSIKVTQLRTLNSRHTKNFATEKNAIFHAGFSHLSGVATNESSKKPAVRGLLRVTKYHLESMGCGWLGR